MQGPSPDALCNVQLLSKCSMEVIWAICCPHLPMTSGNPRQWAASRIHTQAPMCWTGTILWCLLLLSRAIVWLLQPVLASTALGASLSTPAAGVQDSPSFLVQRKIPGPGPNHLQLIAFQLSLLFLPAAVVPLQAWSDTNSADQSLPPQHPTGFAHVSVFPKFSWSSICAATLAQMKKFGV